MELKKNIMKSKKGFMFSFFALLIMIIIFSVGSIYLFDENFTQENSYTEGRIVSVNDEIEYFRKSYVQSFVAYSFYNTTGELIKFLDATDQFDLIDKKPQVLNDLIFKGMTQGGFNGVSISALDGNKIQSFVSEFNDTFSKNKRGDFRYNITKIRIYEEKPYTLTVYVRGVFNVTTHDNVSSWFFEDDFEIKVNMLNTYDPEFAMNTDEDYKLKLITTQVNDNSWSGKLLNKTIYDNLSYVYFEPTREYSIGRSYLNRLLNYSLGSYKDVVGQWSFDKDLEKNGVFDSSLYHNLSNHSGNTMFLLNFNDGTNLPIGTASAGLDCTINGSYGTGCLFDSNANDEIRVNSNDLDFSGLEQFTISAWVNLSSYEDSSSGNSRLFSYGRNNNGANQNEKIRIEFNSNGEIELDLGEHLGGSPEQLIIFDYDVDCIDIGICKYLNKWTNIVININISDSTDSYFTLYVNGRELETIDGLRIDDFLTSPGDIIIGNAHSNEGIEGLLDEFAIYSKSLNQDEITNLFNSRRAEYIDYRDSMFGKSIAFDGVDDFINISHNQYNNISTGNFSACIWFKPYINVTGRQLFHKGNLTNPIYPNTSYFGLRIRGDNLAAQFAGTNITGGYKKVNLAHQDRIKENVNYYSCLTRYNATYNLYLNHYPPESITIFKNLNLTHPNDITVGYDINGAPGPTKFFNGEIDEFKLYNRTISYDEFLLNYYNYESMSKGCCNYITLVNTEGLGFIGGVYDTEDVSRSSKLFFDNYVRGQNTEDIILTDDIIDVDQPRFMVDACLRDAFNVIAYDSTNIDEAGSGPDETKICTELIRLGYY